METLDDIKPGMTIGRYEFLVPIARGGMAAVWAARLNGSRGFSKTVAIKTMLPTLSDDPLFEQMFLDEAQLAAQIHHPNVVEIMDLGEENDVLYLVMEYVDGESVATILRTAAKKQEILPLPIGVRIITDACAGLHSAHELKNVDNEPLGLVHRDISPQNILLTVDGVVKIVDFGVAKAAGRTASETTAGQIKGKAPYMAPEQAMGKLVDRRTDIFAMGIVLYQLTTGKHPFRGENDVSTLHNILHRPVPSPRFVDSKFPRQLENILLKALAQEPEKRFASAAEMAEALDKVFPPFSRRAGPAEVSAFIKGLFGETATKKAEALREAIRRADARSSSAQLNVDGSSNLGLLPLTELGSSVTLSAGANAKALGATTERIPVPVLPDRPSIPTKVAVPSPQPPAPDAPSPLAPPPILDFDAQAPLVDPGAPVSDSSFAPIDSSTLSLSTPTTNPSASSISPKPKPRYALVAALVGTIALVGVAAVVLRSALYKPQVLAAPQPSATTSVDAPSTAAALDSASPEASASATAPAMPTASAEPIASAQQLDSVSHPVDPAKPATAHAAHPNAGPDDTSKGKKPPDPSGRPPTKPGWKPPPVADPGF